MAALALSGTALATEGGGTTATAGAEGFASGVLPPPGTCGLVCANDCQASRFNGDDGHSAIPGFKTTQG